MTSELSGGLEPLEISLASSALPALISLPSLPWRTTSTEPIPNGLNVEEEMLRGSGPSGQDVSKSTRGTK